jgi:hypothetical protein
MNSTKAQLMNLPMRESVRAESCDRVINFRARWQTAVETVSGSRIAEAPSGVGAFRFKIPSYLNAWEQ